MAALICIKSVRGTFCQLVNIANRFLRIFSNLETLVRFIFPGGAGYPYLPTQLIRISSYYTYCTLEPSPRVHLSHHISLFARCITPHHSNIVVKVLRRCGLPQRRSSERSITNHKCPFRINGDFSRSFCTYYAHITLN